MTNENEENKGVTYADAGVDIDAGNDVVDRIKPMVKATARPGSNPDLGGFGGLFDLKAAGFKDPILVAANDGVGTKLKIAIETGILDTVGIDLVAMCVNDLVVQGAEPLFFLDYLATGKLIPEEAARIIAGIVEGCKQAGCALIGGETAEMPGMYHGGDFDLAGFSVGAAERDGLLPRRDMRAGDTLIGLASSGVHSNGFSLVRKLVADKGLTYHDKAPFEPARSLGEVLLTPTRIYVAAALHAIRTTGAVKALAHITGGGLTENIPRILPPSLAAVIDHGTIPFPPVFQWLGKAGQISQSEILRTFNCGIGMVVIADADKSDDVIACLTERGETAVRLGSLEARGNEAVVYRDMHG